ncbi:helix-turn-helix transcriptional regulator [Sagittula sp. S175]|uniref:helix-turn-helix transcriptional regulator n=1 Tax=Sagittula sp. S175 TaxID=3415129 RepID=UPI003C7B59E3
MTESLSTCLSFLTGAIPAGRLRLHPITGRARRERIASASAEGPSPLPRPPAEPQASPALPPFEQSFHDRLCLKFIYRDAKGADPKRQVEPQAVLILPPLCYLVAWDPTREDLRHFRMDRISRPEVVEGAAFRSRHVHFDSGVQRIRYA